MSPVHSPRIVLVSRRFQFRLSLEFMLLQLLLTGLFALGLYVLANSELQANLASAHARYRSLAQMLMPIVLGLTLFSLALSSFLVAFYVSHLVRRVAGPLIHIRAGLEEIAQRRFFLHTGIGEGRPMWELSHSLGKAENVIKGDLTRLKMELAALRRAHEAGDAAETGTRIAAMEEILAAWL